MLEKVKSICTEMLFLQIGGTIDKDYPAGATDHGYEFQIGEAAFLSIMTRAKLPYSWSHGTIMRKDSLDMTEEDRAIVCKHVNESAQEKVVLTHGTDTIHKTAAALSNVQHKTIVLTGAMLPEKFRDSDADFNLGMAIGAVQCLPHGVYIVLYGEVKPWNEYTPR
jgi:L-asparaginase